MLTLVELLAELRRLATADDRPLAARLARLSELFSNPKQPAELAVGRHYAARLLVPLVDAELGNLDPEARLAAITAIRHVFPRNAAARLLRRVARDPDGRVRRTAQWTGAALRIDVRADGEPEGLLHASFPAPAPRGARPLQPTRTSPVLPALHNTAEVAALIGVPVAELRALMRPGAAAGAPYVEFEIAKARGGSRRIAAPRARLRAVQRTILDRILAPVPVHPACHGFVAGRSTLTNAAPHRGAALVVKLDLRDFFPTVHYRRVRGVFAQLGYNAEVAGVLAALTTYRPRLASGAAVWPGVLPQGAPTSPALANLACRRLDRRLAGLAARYGATYTRYADDLTFSFAAAPAVDVGRLLWWIDGICHHEGFAERPDKRRLLRAHQQQRVTGLVVNAGVNLPRADRKRFRAILHNCARHGVASQAREHEDFDAYLRGYAAYLHMVDPQRGRAALDEVDRLLAGADRG